jgi:hypothetical protein
MHQDTTKDAPAAKTLEIVLVPEGMDPYLVAADAVAERKQLIPMRDTVILVDHSRGSCNTPSPGDRVYATRNNYSLGWMNGDIGTMIRGKPDMAIAFDNGSCGSELHQHDFALLDEVTYHRAQGMRLACVVAITSPQNQEQHFKVASRCSDDVILVGCLGDLSGLICTATGFAQPGQTQRPRNPLGQPWRVSIRVATGPARS